MSGLNEIKSNSFDEKDVEKFVSLLNLFSKKAQLTVSVQDALDLAGLLSHAQQVLLPKLKANILGEIKYHENVVPKPRKSKK